MNKKKWLILILVIVGLIILYFSGVFNPVKSYIYKKMGEAPDKALGTKILGGDGIFAGNITSDGIQIVISKEEQKDELNNGVFLYDYNSKIYTRLNKLLSTGTVGPGLTGIISNDSQKIIYSDFINDPNLDNQDTIFYVYSFKESKNIEYNTKENCYTGDGNIVWSPDDKKIAFICSIGDTRQLMIFDIASLRTTVVDIANVNYFDWSPDGRMIVFSYDRNNIYHLGFYDVENNKIIKNENQPKDNNSSKKQAEFFEPVVRSEFAESCEKYNCLNPIWSSDGKKIFFQKNINEKHKYWGYAQVSKDFKLSDFKNITIIFDDDAGIEIYIYSSHSTKNNKLVFTKQLPDYVGFDTFGAKGYNIAIVDLNKFLQK